MNCQNRIDNSSAQTVEKQTERSFSRLSKLFLKSKQFFLKAGVTVKPKNLSNIKIK